MLQVQPRSRPNADALLRSPELANKLQLDSLAVAAANQRSRDAAHMRLMETIKVPQNLAKLGLPKACYPDVRPNSPSAWTVAEQNVQRKQPASHSTPSIPEDNENTEPETNREPTAAVSHLVKPVSKLHSVPSQARVGLVPPLPPPTVAQAPGAHNRGNRVPHPPALSAAVGAVPVTNAPPLSHRPGGYYQRAQYSRV
jgi:hypothetical protein